MQYYILQNGDTDITRSDDVNKLRYVYGFEILCLPRSLTIHIISRLLNTTIRKNKKPLGSRIEYGNAGQAASNEAWSRRVQTESVVYA
jgi:hypothetical protein